MSITNIIILLTVGISALALFNREYFHKLQYNPFLVHHQRQWYRFISHAFIHTDWFHLGVNMYVLYLFGNLAEAFYDYHFDSKSKLFFLLLYAGGVLFSSLPALRNHKDDELYNAVGASGAVSAVLFASILFFPTYKLKLLFIPMGDGIPAYIFGVLYLAFEIYMAKRAKDNIAHDAHYWGAIYGILFTIAIKPSIVPEFIEKIMNQ